MSGVRVAVVGAGAAGIFAAWRAATLGAQVDLLEKTDRIGTKILISGGGKCNITHDGPLEEVLRAFRPNEARFIRPACYRFPNTEVVRMLTDRGLEVYTRPDGRIFPVHGTAKDVVAILEDYLREAGVRIHLETPVTAICGAPETGVEALEAGGKRWPCRRLVLATGGSSYPKSGTTGDGWPWARRLGHRVEKVRAALAPIDLELDSMPVSEAAGVALRDTLLKARLSGKEIARWRGDLLFTHRGVSGPTVLGISRVVAERIHEGAVWLEVDLWPDLPFEEAGARLRSLVDGRRAVATVLEDVVPKRLATALAQTAGLDPATPGGALAKKAVNRLLEELKGWRLGQVKLVPLEKGEVVAGGVALDEVDPRTMRSLRCSGLYLAGEVLDVAGPVGGYNLQAAFATGYVAGESAAREL